MVDISVETDRPHDERSLRKLGGNLRLCKDSRADFSGMTRSAVLTIQDVMHNAMVGFDENGVEAAAATAESTLGGSAPTAVRTVRADKPFFFAIVDKVTNTVLFAGHVADPTK